MHRLPCGELRWIGALSHVWFGVSVENRKHGLPRIEALRDTPAAVRFRVKHDLIRAYLGGWFAKLGTWAGRVLYIDTHAGRGRHSSGELGSPLVALTTLLGHSHRDRLLKQCEFWFWFIERDAENLRAVEAELRALGTLPPRVEVRLLPGDAFHLLAEAVERLRTSGRNAAPAFVFVDPYGFKVPGRVLQALMNAGPVELFINVIWRELDTEKCNGGRTCPWRCTAT